MGREDDDGSGYLFTREKFSLTRWQTNGRVRDDSRRVYECARGNEKDSSSRRLAGEKERANGWTPVRESFGLFQFLDRFAWP